MINRGLFVRRANLHAATCGRPLIIAKPRLFAEPRTALERRAFAAESRLDESKFASVSTNSPHKFATCANLRNELAVKAVSRLQTRDKRNLGANLQLKREKAMRISPFYCLYAETRKANKTCKSRSDKTTIKKRTTFAALLRARLSLKCEFRAIWPPKLRLDSAIEAIPSRLQRQSSGRISENQIAKKSRN